MDVEFDINPQILHDFANNIDTCDLCADIGYFLILPFAYQHAKEATYMTTIPYVVTYTDETTKMKIIMQEYKSMNSLVEKKRLQFTMKSGHTIGEELTIRDLKLEMGGANINGLNLFTTVSEPSVLIKDYSDSDSSDQDIYEDECCISTYLQGQQGFGNKYITLTIEIMLQNRMAEVFTVSVDGQQNYSSFVKIVLNEIKKIFGINLVQADLVSIINKQTKKPLNNEKFIMSQKIYNGSKLSLRLKNPTIQLKRLKTKDYNSYITIYKEGEKDPKKFKYSQIAELTFSQLYTSHLELQESKQRKELHYGLKINDLIIKPNEKINLAEKYFKHDNKDPLNVVAKVINQKMVFFHTVPSLLQKAQEFDLDKHIKIPKNQEEKRRNVRLLSKDRAKKTKNEYFKHQQRLEPILIYTSELRYYQGKQKKQCKIYQSLNRFLRENPLLTLQESQLKQQWRYLYSSALLKHLQNIEKFQGKTYRGVSYDPKTEVGKILTFKQFLSTSVCRKTAVSFASKSSNPIKHLFQLEISQGYPIKEYSEYMKQEEILLQPFTDFEVVNIQQAKQSVNGKNVTFKIYSLKQLKTQKRLPDIKANFLIWIDDKPKQGQQIFSRIDMPKETTILVQIFSTEELVKWLKKNQFLFSDPTANLIFISNMSRMQNEKFNEIAGIEGLRQIRRYSPQMQVFFYIGDVGKAKKKLTDNNVNLNDVIIGKSANEVHQFINKKITENK